MAHSDHTSKPRGVKQTGWRRGLVTAAYWLAVACCAIALIEPRAALVAALLTTFAQALRPAE